jgi:pimeloyl-ACP methyl ester carboxylesterase
MSAASLVAVVVLALVLGASAWQMLATSRDRKRHPPRGRLVTAGRSHLHACQVGGGVPGVVFEAGVAATSLTWGPVQQRVAAKTATVAYDRAGLGWSGPLRTDATAMSSARELDLLLANAGVEPPFVLVGHSYGAFVTSLFASAQAERVAGLVLVDPLTPGEWRDSSSRRRLTGGIILSYVGAVLAALGVVRFCLNRLSGGARQVPQRVLHAFGPDATKLVERLIGEVTKLPPDLWPSVQAHWSRPRSFLSMARYLRALPASVRQVEHCWDALADAQRQGRLSTPPWPVVLLSCAAADSERRAAHDAIGRAFPFVTVRLVPECGHWIQLDRPELVASTVLEVVAASRQPTRTQGLGDQGSGIGERRRETG